MKNLVVFLNGSRGIEVVRAVLGTDHVITAIVTPPNFDPANVRNVLDGSAAMHLRVSNVNDPAVVAELRSLAPELFVIAGYSTILRENLLSVPTRGTINLHGGRLPQYRGGSPLNWQLINGEREAVLSVIRVEQDIDAGPVLAESSLPIAYDETIASLHERANTIFPRLVVEVLDDLNVGVDRGRIQDYAAAQYWHQRNDADGLLEFGTTTAAQADRVIRALTRPYPGAWAYCGTRRVRLFSAVVPSLVVRGVPGRICYIQNNGPYVVCADRAILITEYEVEGSNVERLRHGERLKSAR